MSSYTPDKWLLIKMPTCTKVFGTWNGGYLYGPSWQMNSGIASVEVDGDFINFHGYSGSVYRCYKDHYGCVPYGYTVLSTFPSEDMKIYNDYDEYLTETENKL